MTGPVLTTERLTLRPPTLADLGAYAAFYAVSDVPAGKYRRPRSGAEMHTILAEDIGHWRRKGFGMWLITRKGSQDGDTGEVVGGCGLAHPDDWPRHELTWWLMPAKRGTGFATEASQAVIRFAYDTLGWDVVETHMRDQNLPARRLAQRLGGKVIAREVFPDGVARDIFVLPHPDELEGAA